MDEQDERKLWEQLSQGDYASFKEILQLYHAGLFMWIRGMVKSSEITHEILVKCFSALWEKCNEGTASNLKDYLVLVVRENTKREMRMLIEDWDAKEDKDTADFWTWAEARKPRLHD